MKKLKFIAVLICCFFVTAANSQNSFWVGHGGDSMCFIVLRAGVYKVAFAGCKNSTLLNIPSSVEFRGVEYEVTSIAYQALTGNRKVVEINIPKSVKSVENNAFEGCTNLKKVSVSSGVTTIGDYVFQDCTSLRECVLPETVKTLGEAVFRGCDHLKSVVLPNTLTEIPYKMFMGCFKLQSINIPASVIAIGDYAFCNCTMLRDLKIPDAARIEKSKMQYLSVKAALDILIIVVHGSMSKLCISLQMRLKS
mgnify:CR=1 FL=1